MCNYFSLVLRRRLSEAEDRLDAAAAAAAANEESRLRLSQALQSEAAQARGRAQELEVVSQQHAALMQTRAQSERQHEETISQLRQVRLQRTNSFRRCCRVYYVIWY
jgi:hypothetical protein